MADDPAPRAPLASKGLNVNFGARQRVLTKIISVDVQGDTVWLTTGWRSSYGLGLTVLHS
jgi:hypothetical protein